MQSARITVLSRCAITRTVRPCIACQPMNQNSQCTEQRATSYKNVTRHQPHTNHTLPANAMEPVPLTDTTCQQRLKARAKIFRLLAALVKVTTAAWKKTTAHARHTHPFQSLLHHTLTFSVQRARRLWQRNTTTDNDRMYYVALHTGTNHTVVAKLFRAREETDRAKPHPSILGCNPHTT